MISIFIIDWFIFCSILLIFFLINFFNFAFLRRLFIIFFNYLFQRSTWLEQISMRSCIIIRKVVFYLIYLFELIIFGLNRGFLFLRMVLVCFCFWFRSRSCDFGSSTKEFFLLWFFIYFNWWWGFWINRWFLFLILFSWFLLVNYFDSFIVISYLSSIFSALRSWRLNSSIRSNLWSRSDLNRNSSLTNNRRSWLVHSRASVVHISLRGILLSWCVHLRSILSWCWSTLFIIVRLNWWWTFRINCYFRFWLVFLLRWGIFIHE